MYKITLLLSTTLIIISCNKSEKNVNQETVIEKSSVNKSISDSSKFSVEDLPYITTDIGDFPFFSLPDNVIEMNKPLVRDFDVIYFPLNGKLQAVEGKIYKANIKGTPENPFSQHYFVKSFDDYLTALGAVKIFDNKLTKEDYELRKNGDPNIGDEGDIGYQDEHVKCYVLRTKDKGNIYVQFSADNAAGKLNILQESQLTQTIQ